MEAAVSELVNTWINQAIAAKSALESAFALHEARREAELDGWSAEDRLGFSVVESDLVARWVEDWPSGQWGREVDE
jgi:hypothetical protein